jgi:hypothetical protein
MAKKISANKVLEQAVMKIGNMLLDADGAYKVIMAAGWDVAEQRARAAGRDTWSRADYNAAARFTNDLFVRFGLAPAV